jgi:hypothetical protein
VYLDQCIQNADLINDYFNKELTSTIDYVSFAEAQEKLINPRQDFNQNYVQLRWVDDTMHHTFIYDFQSSTKFIGEAGIGKTTQMKKMFLSLVEQIRSNPEMQILPIWINLANLTKENLSLEQKIKEMLGEETAPLYELLLKHGMLALFLDGYNEVLDDTVKVSLANEIDNMIHREYPNVPIAMTDRRKISNPPCLTGRGDVPVIVYECEALSEDMIRKYVELKATDNTRKSLLDYLDSPDSHWMRNTPVIPAKLESLIALMSSGSKPLSEDDFYGKYLDYILDRERNEKKDMRISTLVELLQILAEHMDKDESEMERRKITDFWLHEGYTGTRDVAIDYFVLAYELGILTTGSNDRAFKFRYKQYYYKALEGNFNVW